MKVLIIYAHPEGEGFSSYTLKKLTEELKLQKIDFEFLDLYKEKFDPVLKNEELYTRENGGEIPDIKEKQEKIKQSDALIFIYPTWWGGMPAILKGFIDRVFTPGFAFKYNSEKLLKFIPDKLLPDKKIIIFTSMGAPKFIYRLLFNPVKKINNFIIFGLFTSKVKTIQTYSALSLTSKKKQEISRKIKKKVKWILKNN